MIWSYRKRRFINPSFRENLNVLLKLLKSDYNRRLPLPFSFQETQISQQMNGSKRFKPGASEK
eukprot:13581927-Ditylum_brightwellii.AAC.1